MQMFTQAYYNSQGYDQDAHSKVCKCKRHNEEKCCILQAWVYFHCPDDQDIAQNRRYSNQSLHSNVCLGVEI